MSYPGNGNRKAAPYASIRDEKSAGTNGGTFTSGDWRTRDLTATSVDEIGVSLSSNQFTLPAGEYEIEIHAPALHVGRHQARLQNITDAETTLLGASTYSDDTPPKAQNVSYVGGKFTIDESKTFEVQHQCETTNSSVGFGLSNSFSSVEVYTTVELRKVT